MLFFKHGDAFFEHGDASFGAQGCYFLNMLNANPLIHFFSLTTVPFFSNRMTFLPADSEDGQIFIRGIFCFLALHVGIFWHLELVVAFFGDFLALHVDIFLAFRIGRGIF